jgi:YegS/Rv2252/BmrU family lipid kinase
LGTRALLLVNKHARQGEEAHARVVAAIAGEGIEITEDRAPHESISQAIVRHKDDVDLVIVGGGDGSLNEAIAGLLETGLPLGIIPLGTANDLARTLGIPTEIEAACQSIARGQTQAIDVGEANGRYFFNVASLGLSATIARRLESGAKKRWGVLAYLWTAIQVTARARLFHAEIRTPAETFHVKTLQIAVGNGVHYGGGMVVSDRAAIDDGRLDLYSLEARHWWQLFWLLPHFLRGTLGTTSWVRALHGTEFEVITRRPRSVNTDGEITTQTPVVFRVRPKAVRVVVDAENG